MSWALVSEGDLVQRCRRGNDDAWSELVERFSGYVYAIVSQGFRLSSHDAEDVFQEVFAKVHEHLGRLRDDEAFRPWLAQLTRRACFDRIRARRGDEPGAEELELPDLDETLDRLAEALTVQDALARLPSDCGEVLRRFFVCDESYRTIGDALDLPAGTVASRISRCLGRLRAELAEENAGNGRLENG